MGVPAFFRWLSRKYSAIVVHCVEEKPKIINGVKVPVDTSLPNPNDTEFDNLYLDMNGIIHPCCHPEDKPAPKNEDEMMVDIFAYIDRIFSIVRPRKVLYMAIDGVAPRAKMNQQRSRRFRASKESVEKVGDMARIREEVASRGGLLPPEKKPSEHFDSNCITPGTPFMFRLAECLRYYIHDRLNNDPGWRNIKVILSDANTPGEGEHKIMDYIRRQRAQPDHDPNTHHCLCGADADLIMLGLATHEPHFTIIREEFKPNKPHSCDLCGQFGHEMKECNGLPKEKEGENDELEKPIGQEQEFIFLRLNVLREYLKKELRMDGLPFTYDFERCVDDWVFMCFFVGNDFLPHLPSLEIREGAIDRLVSLYKKAVYKTGGYLTDSGVVSLDRVQLVMTDLGEAEDEIFSRRRDNELMWKKREKDKKKRLKDMDKAQAPKWIMGGQFSPQALGRGGRGGGAISNPRQEMSNLRQQAMNYGTSSSSRDGDNQSAAKALKAMLVDGSEKSDKGGANGSEQRGTKRKAEDEEEDEPEPEDNVRLWEEGWKDRYYEGKFDVKADDIAFRHKVANEYVMGLCWVLRYYYQGCASWKWYFPYHYAPFASDFVNIGDLPNDFERNTQPFKPLEQLMGVFPAGSKAHLPPTWQVLMCDPESPIIDFYPVDFKIDLNGKKYAWQGVALLPFVDEKRLHSALETVYPDLTDDEQTRNTRGNDRLFLNKWHDAFDLFCGLYENGGTVEKVDMDGKKTQGMAGIIWCDKAAVTPGVTVRSPLPQLKDLTDNQALSVQFLDPQFEDGHLFKSSVLPGASFPADVLKPGDMPDNRGSGYRPQLGFKRGSGYRGRGQKDSSAAVRHIRQGTGGQYSNAPPPNSYSGRQRSYTSPGGGGGYGQQGGGGYGHQGSWGSQSQSQYGGQPMSWQRNIAGQQGAYQQNMQRGYSTGGQGYGGAGGYQSPGSSYQSHNQGRRDNNRSGGGRDPYGSTYSKGSSGGGRDPYDTGSSGNRRGGSYPNPPGYRRY
ncbi:5'-3' exoribonuclease 2-like [Lineus longissimus]|uniref:5'-3' exoribonuclease 2-like n=1 Tax=Lineus longissimus TaxID=88925 RepID=UPI002B4D1A73